MLAAYFAMMDVIETVDRNSFFTQIFKICTKRKEFSHNKHLGSWVIIIESYRKRQNVMLFSIRLVNIRYLRYFLRFLPQSAESDKQV